jgi:hypothetical protein
MTDDGNILKSDRKWQSDIIVDLIKQYGFKHIALNPGASYRGLHDSLVNYGENDPAMMICNHEKIAVRMGQCPWTWCKSVFLRVSLRRLKLPVHSAAIATELSS